MPITVFANGDGFFHSGSGGSGQAFPDVCLSPPPPPAGPIPIPYPNMVQASDLTDGSKTVKIDGSPTALEDASSISTSSGDEGGTQGGNVLTHKTKGKGYFKLWSFDVKVEGKGVDRHGDPIAQNCASNPPGSIAPMARVETAYALSGEAGCTEDYDDSKRPSITEDQYYEVEGGPCWQCKCPSPAGWYKAPAKGKKGVPFAPVNKKGKPIQFTPDHQPPIAVLWFAGGCHMSKKDFADLCQDPEGVKPHCRQCSQKQSSEMRDLTGQMRTAHFG